MGIQQTADARTALMAAYIARRTNPQAGSAGCGRERKSWEGETSGQGFGARGRTIYNANRRRRVLSELERIDEEEEKKKKKGRCGGHWDQFLMAARDGVEKKTGTSAAELATAEDMFALYIHI